MLRCSGIHFLLQVYFFLYRPYPRDSFYRDRTRGTWDNFYSVLEGTKWNPMRERRVAESRPRPERGDHVVNQAGTLRLDWDALECRVSTRDKRLILVLFDRCYLLSWDLARRSCSSRGILGTGHRAKSQPHCPRLARGADRSP